MSGKIQILPGGEPPEAARAELLASLERGEDDVKAKRVKRMTVAELKADMRSDFERVTGYKLT